MRRETLRSLACIGATVIGMIVHRNEPERVATMTIVFCLVTAILDYALNRDDRPKAVIKAIDRDFEAQRQAMELRSQEAAEWLKGKRH